MAEASARMPGGEANRAGRWRPARGAAASGWWSGLRAEARCLAGLDVAIGCSGARPERARAEAARLVAAGAAGLVSFGLAGGLSPGLARGRSGAGRGGGAAGRSPLATDRGLAGPSRRGARRPPHAGLRGCRLPAATGCSRARRQKQPCTAHRPPARSTWKATSWPRRRAPPGCLSSWCARSPIRTTGRSRRPRSWRSGRRPGAPARAARQPGPAAARAVALCRLGRDSGAALASLRRAARLAGRALDGP